MERKRLRPWNINTLRPDSSPDASPAFRYNHHPISTPPTPLRATPRAAPGRCHEPAHVLPPGWRAQPGQFHLIGQPDAFSPAHAPAIPPEPVPPAAVPLKDSLSEMCQAKLYSEPELLNVKHHLLQCLEHVEAALRGDEPTYVSSTEWSVQQRRTSQRSGCSSRTSRTWWWRRPRRPHD